MLLQFFARMTGGLAAGAMLAACSGGGGAVNPQPAPAGGSSISPAITSVSGLPQRSTSSVRETNGAIRQKVNLGKPLAFTEFPLPNPAPSVDSPGGAVAIDSAGTPWVLTTHAVVRVSASGQTTSFPMPSGVNLIGGITLGSDGAFWFQGLTPDPRPYTSGILTVFRLTTTGSLTSYPVEPGVFDVAHGWQPQDITAGIGGKLWFTWTTTSYAESTGAAFATITTAGTLSAFTEMSGAHQLTTGPDGNMWLAASVYDDVGEPADVASISENGVVQKTFAFAAYSDPTGIATGPDHNLWVTFVGTNTIVRLTTAGASTSYLVPTPNAFDGIFAWYRQSARIVSGDKEMWFTEGGAGRIGRITMSGKITEYPIPTANLSPVGLAVSRPCDSNLTYVWFLESNPNHFGPFPIKPPVKLGRFTFKENRATCGCKSRDLSTR